MSLHFNFLNMGANSLRRIVVDKRVDVGVTLLAVMLSTATAYYTGRTGNWRPLIAVSSLLTIFVVSAALKEGSVLLDQ